MKQIIHITPQWQIYLPQKIRKFLSLERPGQAEVEVKDDIICIKPLKSAILKHAGKFQKFNTPPVDVENIRDHIDYSQI